MLLLGWRQFVHRCRIVASSPSRLWYPGKSGYMSELKSSWALSSQVVSVLHCPSTIHPISQFCQSPKCLAIMTLAFLADSAFIKLLTSDDFSMDLTPSYHPVSTLQSLRDYKALLPSGVNCVVVGSLTSFLGIFILRHKVDQNNDIVIY